MIAWLTAAEAAKLAGVDVHALANCNAERRGELKNGRFVVNYYDAIGVVNAYRVRNWKVRLLRIELDRAEARNSGTVR